MPSPQPFMVGFDSNRPLKAAFEEESSESAQRPFVPGDIPIAPEFPALLGVVGDPLEADTFMQCDRGWVWQRDPRVRSVHVIALESLEQLFVEAGAGAATDRLRRQIDAGLDGGFVRRLMA